MGGVSLHVEKGQMKASTKVILLAVIAIAWIALDQLTKSVFAGMQPGDSLGLILGGLVDLRLVHNTGAAWGIFAGATGLLGAFSIVVVCVLVGYIIWDRESANLAQVVGAALVAAGGIGNVIDRFSQGYVTDFLAVTFMDFPVFNVADIGVTCGVVVLFIGFALEWRKESARSGQEETS